MEYRQRTLRVPGVAIAIRFRDEILLSRAYGMADQERGAALTTGHAFRIASQSKMFTATAVMQLVEQGRLRLDDRAGGCLPWLPSGEGQIGRVTIRQLLSHSGGVIRDGEEGGFWQLERDFPDADELRRVLSATPPVLAQNQRFKYSNFGYGLLGLLVAEAAGMPYNAYVRRHVVDRLGLADTGPELDEHALARLATGYTGAHYGLDRLPLQHVRTGALSPATGFYSTAEDLCRFGAAQFLGNEELLSDESKREMQHEQWKVDGVPHSYGLGFDVYPVGERRLIGHGGGFPGFITHTRIDPADRLVLVALTNAGDGPAADLTNGMVAIVNRAVEADPLPDGRAPGDLDRFTGRYWSLGGAIDVVRFGGELLGMMPAGPNPADQAMELTVEGPDQLRITKAPGFGSPGERVRYLFDGAGRATEVRWAATTLRPWEAFRSGVLAGVRATGRAPQQDPA
ncbi:MAG TPA: serine hydrolase domain-containing protein [Candidatus Dormibacteraeota bacterium]|nr:serine hydrolase domain-containing protein [Candidatus Dormibacteraeota bacterium]